MMMVVPASAGPPQGSGMMPMGHPTAAEEAAQVAKAAEAAIASVLEQHSCAVSKWGGGCCGGGVVCGGGCMLACMCTMHTCLCIHVLSTHTCK